MFQQVRAAWNSRSTVLCQHVIQSFKPDEITPELAHQIGMELAERLLGEEYQFVLATHTDKAHIHNHLIFCNVNMMNGKSFETLQNKGSKKSWKTLRPLELLHVEYKLVEQVNAIIWSRRGFGVILHRTNRQGRMAKTLNRAVVQ